MDRVEDHPRVRGEQDLLQDNEARYYGPPPRARGAVEQRGGGHRLRGTTPACAGSRRPHAGASEVHVGTTPACAGSSDRPLSRRVVDARDHPRVRGEQTTSRCRMTVAVRTTPACAGSSRAP